MKNNEKIEISKEEYDRLVKSDNFLAALEAAGVDNWDGYSEAIKILKEGIN